MKISIKKIILITLLLVSNSLFAEVAKVVSLKGEALLIRDNKTLTLTRASLIQKDDKIETKQNTKVQLLFKDETIISIGKNSSFLVSNYLFDEKNKNYEAKFSMLKGTFRTITGKIGKFAPKKFNLKTKSASIGIRGTQIVMNLSPDLEQIFCTEGKIFIQRDDNGISSTLQAGEFVNIEKEMGSLKIQKINDAVIKNINQNLTIKKNLANDNITVNNETVENVNEEDINNNEIVQTTTEETPSVETQNVVETAKLTNEVDLEKTVEDKKTQIQEDLAAAEEAAKLAAIEQARQEQLALEAAQAEAEALAVAQAAALEEEEAQAAALAAKEEADAAAAQAAADALAQEEAQAAALAAQEEAIAAQEALDAATTAAEIQAAQDALVAAQNAADAAAAQEAAAQAAAAQAEADADAAAQAQAQADADVLAQAKASALTQAEANAAAAALVAALVAAEDALEKAQAAQELQEEATSTIEIINDATSVVTYKGNFNNYEYNTNSQYLKNLIFNVEIPKDSTISMDIDFGKTSEQISNGKIKVPDDVFNEYYNNTFNFAGNITDGTNFTLEGNTNTTGTGSGSFTNSEKNNMSGEVNFEQTEDDIAIIAQFDSSLYDDSLEEITPESYFDETNSVATYNGNFNDYEFNNGTQYLQNVNKDKVEISNDTTISMQIDFAATSEHISNGKIDINDVGDSTSRLITFDGEIDVENSSLSLSPVGDSKGSGGSGYFYGSEANLIEGDVNMKTSDNVQIVGDFKASKQ